jgi:hypothetical protein
MRKATVRVRSIFGHVLRHVSHSEALRMIGQDSHGNELENLEPVARRLTRKKAPLTDIRLLAPERLKNSDPCSITPREMELNAYYSEPKQVYNHLAAGESIRELERAIAKIDFWPDVHDDRNVIISAGHAHGVVHQAVIPDPIISFA